MVAVASITPADVAAAYHERGDRSPVALGDMILACRRELGIGQQELARRSGIRPGTLHHYESVALLPEPYRGYADNGRLTMKEARSLADLGWGRARYYRPDPRFAEIADLFVHGRLSSVYVEPVVHEAKRDPEASADVIVERVLSPLPRKPKTWIPPAERERRCVDVTNIVKHILALAGEVDAWGMQEHCEVERLPVLAAARLLDDRMHRAILHAVDVRGPDHREPSRPADTRLAALVTEEPDRRPRKGQGSLL